MKRAAAVALVILLTGCQTVSDTYNQWFGTPRIVQKPAELTTIQPTATLRILWRGGVGRAEKSVFFPAVSSNVVYATGTNGQIGAFDAVSGTPAGQVDTGQRLSGGVGAGAGLVVVGTGQGEVLAFEPEGKQRWKAQLTGEVLAPPVAEDGIVVARTGDGRIFGLDSVTGARKWVYQRSTPSLSVRSHVGVVVYRGAVFAGFAGGRLVALSLSNGNVGWESVVAFPRGTTELERVADVTSLPVVDDQVACAVAFQGRVACFNPVRGSLVWARDVSSIAGMASDGRNVYITDDRSAVVAHDQANGASVWKQDKLFGRGLTGPLAIGRHVVVGDFEGYVHVLSRDDGAFAARIATDGSAVIAPPAALNSSSFVVQTRDGGVFAITVQ
ncbi:MAG: outer membrane protein assembly factor BamB [Betaproteobacteria bacterium]|nr:outer membrane protein assembly factor BamB [Betaproteobacteria bacterium]